MIFGRRHAGEFKLFILLIASVAITLRGHSALIAPLRAPAQGYTRLVLILASM
ncbi:hypothetical protein [Xanthomonas hortorum]|uniref:hypothetical protein n=1 Tax=Xanthomonas hortorum TaxID=56454 RepID=UPI003D2F7559